MLTRVQVTWKLPANICLGPPSLYKLCDHRHNQKTAARQILKHTEQEMESQSTQVAGESGLGCAIQSGSLTHGVATESVNAETT